MDINKYHCVGNVRYANTPVAWSGGHYPGGILEGELKKRERKAAAGS